MYDCREIQTILSHRNSANRRLWPSSQTNPTILIRTQWKGLQGMTKVALVFDVQLLSCVWLFGTPWTAARQVALSFTISKSLLKIRSIESMMPSNHLTLCCPLLLLPSVFPSIRVFSSKLVLPIRWPKYWSFSFSISLSNAYSVSISFGMDWFDLLASQESSPAPQLESISSLAFSLLSWSNSYIHTWLLEKS